MRRFLTCLVAALPRGRMLVAGWLVLSLLAVVAGSGAARAQTPLPALPEVSAAAVVAVDASAGVTLFERDADVPRPPASLVKLMTALVVADRVDWDATVTIVPSDEVDIKVYSHVGETGLLAGDTLTVRQLLAGLLIPSGNDAAMALARFVGAQLPGGEGGEEAARAAFVGAMNEKARALGLANTRFTNPSGVDDPEQVASARDLATLARLLLEDERFAEIVRVSADDIVSVGPEARPYALRTTNTLLVDSENPYRVHGVKTGTTGDAGGNLVSASYFGEQNRVIVVVMGSTYQAGEAVVDDRYPDTRSILATLAEEYEWVDPASPNPADLPGLAGLADELRAWQVRLQPGAAVPIPKAARTDLRYFLQLGPSGEPGDPAGEVRFFVGDVATGVREVVQS